MQIKLEQKGGLIGLALGCQGRACFAVRNYSGTFSNTLVRFRAVLSGLFGLRSAAPFRDFGKTLLFQRGLLAIPAGFEPRSRNPLLYPTKGHHLEWLANDRIFKCDAFRIVVPKPFVRGVLGREQL